MKTAALYARVSTGKQEESDLSIPDQVRQLKDYAKREGLAIIKIYEDGKSGKTDKRDAFQQMISDGMNRKFDIILMLTTSRFFRDRAEAAAYKKRLRKKGVEIKAIHQDIPEGPTGEIIEGFYELMDHYESIMIAFHVQRNMIENAKRGYFNGSQVKYWL